MKRILLATIMLLLAGLMVYAQQAGGASQPSSAETRQTAQQTLAQAQSNSTQFESTLASLKAQNVSNNDAAAYRKLKAHIDQLESRIRTEQAQMQAKLDQGLKVSSSVTDQIQRLIEQHKSAMADMEGFIAR
jgi:molecular chaperone GrpE (heat shock protein)